MYINSTPWKTLNILYIYSFLANLTLSYRINNTNVYHFNNSFKNDINTYLNGIKNIKLKSFSLSNAEHNQRVHNYTPNLENERDQTNQQHVKVRFAPSPTGLLHTGSLRTYIYNYLFAKKTKGTLFLRIDDTDETRIVPESMDDILSNLRWTGLEWNEGVFKSDNGDSYYQSNRHHLYRQYAEELLDTRHAYRCFCRESLAKKLLQKLFNFNLSNNCDKCFNMKQDDLQSMLNKKKKYTIKFRSNTRDFDDFILIRSNGTATYNFSSTVDDILMKITHVIRGSDHLFNTNKQKAIFDALKAKRPQFVNIPFITDENQNKLSKRTGGGDYTVRQIRLDGICSLPLINYLTFLGTKFADQKRILTVDELSNVFSFDILNPLPIVFNYKKLLNLNRKYISSVDSKTLLRDLSEFLEYYLYNKDDSNSKNNNKNKDNNNTNEVLEQEKLFEEDKRLLTEVLVDVYKNQINTLREYFLYIKQSLRYNYDNIKSKPKEEYAQFFTKWLTNELDWILKQSTNSIDLHLNYTMLLSQMGSSSEMIEQIKTLRFLMTGEEKGPSMMDMAKTWKIGQDMNFPNFVNLKERLINVKNILS